ncbi:MAG: serine/threonine protein kinase, partial [Planctomycetales bacterium]
MAVQTSASLVDLLEQSKLLSPEELQSIRPLAQTVRDPKNLASRLIRHGLVTPWQTKQLLRGGMHFFILHYKLLDKLGQGGMGAVYKAQDTTTQQIVAVKILHQQSLGDRNAVERFRREVRIASSLRHPNIVAALDGGQVGEDAYLVMEYVEGKDVKQWQRLHPELPVDWCCECGKQAALGLQHAHEQGMVHRDVKPANILAAAADLKVVPQVKILDMGLARSLVGDFQDLTGTGEVLGTVDYLSPEQARSTKHVDIRSDVFSLGCTLFKMLSGEAAFVGKTNVEKLLSRNGPPRDLNQLRPDAPRELVAVVGKMLALDPKRRHQTPVEVAEALAPFSMTREVVQRSSSPRPSSSLSPRPSSSL